MPQSARSMLNKRLTGVVGAPLRYRGIGDPRELERIDPRLRCTDAVSALSACSAAALSRVVGLFARLTRPIPALRDQYLRYEFDAAKQLSCVGTALGGQD